MSKAIPDLRHKTQKEFKNRRFDATKTGFWLKETPQTLRNSVVDKQQQTFNGSFDQNPLSEEASIKLSQLKTPTRRFRKPVDVEFIPHPERLTGPRDKQIFDILIEPRYTDKSFDQELARSRSPTSNRAYGWGQIDQDIQNDKNKNLMQTVRAKSSSGRQGDKITNVSKTRLGIKIRNLQYPQAKSNSHEIGIENCDKLGGKNLGHYVKRV